MASHLYITHDDVYTKGVEFSIVLDYVSGVSPSKLILVAPHSADCTAGYTPPTQVRAPWWSRLGTAFQRLCEYLRHGIAPLV